MSHWIPPENRNTRAEQKAAIDWQVTGHPYTYLVTDFVPRLKERGVADDVIESILVDNPRRLLSGS
jgi:predicted metal-dependent phosphotriesterase family hydrolase